MSTPMPSAVSDSPDPSADPRRVDPSAGAAPLDEVEELLSRWGAGDRRAGDRLLTLLYPELRAVAAGCRRRRPSAVTFQTTELIQELYLKLAQRRGGSALSRAHFFAIAAQAMRQILVDAARRKNRDKRGGGWVQLSIDEAPVFDLTAPPAWLALDEAMEHLGQIDATALRVVEMRFFAGLTGAEIADVLGVSRRTVNRHWRFARAWLRERLEAPSGPAQAAKGSESAGHERHVRR